MLLKKPWKILFLSCRRNEKCSRDFCFSFFSSIWILIACVMLQCFFFFLFTKLVGLEICQNKNTKAYTIKCVKKMDGTQILCETYVKRRNNIH